MTRPDNQKDGTAKAPATSEEKLKLEVEPVADLEPTEQAAEQVKGGPLRSTRLC